MNYFGARNVFVFRLRGLSLCRCDEFKLAVRLEMSRNNLPRVQCQHYTETIHHNTHTRCCVFFSGHDTNSCSFPEQLTLDYNKNPSLCGNLFKPNMWKWKFKLSLGLFLCFCLCSFILAMKYQKLNLNTGSILFCLPSILELGFIFRSIFLKYSTWAETYFQA